MFVIILFLLQWSNDVSAQGLFSPADFTESKCSGSNQWTIWFDSGNPSSTLGEFEVTTHIQQLYSLYMCPVPVAIEVIMFSLYFF